MLLQEIEGMVNPELKVYRVENLRVVDISIMPMLLAAYIQATVYAIAEKVSNISSHLPQYAANTLQAADLIKASY
jgi:choline dehydrogenase-like flavoprotein